LVDDDFVVAVEEFILDQTLDPAIAEFGLKEVTLIDPTCGSGHLKQLCPLAPQLKQSTSAPPLMPPPRASAAPPTPPEAVHSEARCPRRRHLRHTSLR
jgi:hypothetical protein